MSAGAGRKFCQAILTLLLILCFVSGGLFLPSLQAAGAASPGDQVEVTNPAGFRLRRKPATDAEQVNYLSDGEVFTVLAVVEGQNVTGFGDQWYLLNYEGEEVYCIADLSGVKQKIIPRSTPSPAPTPVPAETTAPPAEVTPAPTAPAVTPSVTPAVTPAASDSEQRTDVPSAYTPEEWQTVLSAFPASYHELLNQLHRTRPTWRYEPYYHNFSLEFAADVELAEPARNLVPYYYREYRHPSNNKMYDAGGWYACNRAALLFMMDPRNWLNEKYIFMFEKLSEVENVAGERRLQHMFRNNEDLKKLIPTILEASKAHGVSPVFVGARMLTEVQTTINGKKTISRSAKGTLRISEEEIKLLGLNVDPEVPYYNLFNIGAYQGSNPQKNAVLYAMGYGLSEETKRNLSIPWDSPYKAIYGGITFIKRAYLDEGQNSNYYMKYNLRNSKETLKDSVWHQYMGSVFAPATEASVQYVANLRAEALDENYTFYIPVFEDMPLTPYPNPGSRYPDAVPPQQPAGGDGMNPSITDPVRFAAAGTVLELSKPFVLRQGPTFNDAQITTLEKGSRVTVLGRQTGSFVETLSDQWYKVDAGGTQGYIVAFPLSQKVISTPGEPDPEPSPAPEKEFLLGDTDGDGKISVNDSVLIRYYLIGKIQLGEAEMKAADTDKDGRISVNDSVLIRYHLIGKFPLEQ